MTTGVAALGSEAVARIVKTIEVYDDFCHANDPYEEHDFGSFEADGHTIFFKIDYFDTTLTVSFARSVRPSRHQARDHHHAGRGILKPSVHKSPLFEHSGREPSKSHFAVAGAPSGCASYLLSSLCHSYFEM